MRAVRRRFASELRPDDAWLTNFGDGKQQYHATVCGGAGAGIDCDAASAVHTHMSNSRLTDVEVLEHHVPVRLERFAIRCDSGGGAYGWLDQSSAAGDETR